MVTQDNYKEVFTNLFNSMKKGALSDYFADFQELFMDVMVKCYKLGQQSNNPGNLHHLTVEEAALAYLNSIGITGKYQIEAAGLRINDFKAGAQWQQSNRPDNLHHLTDEELLKAMQDYSRREKKLKRLKK